MAGVRVANLAFGYAGGFNMRIAGLEVPGRACTAIVGPSGSGKTTLLNLLSGTLTPSTGEILVGETRIDSLGDAARRRFRMDHIGQVFQAFELLEQGGIHQAATRGFTIGVRDDAAPAADFGNLGLHVFQSGIEQGLGGALVVRDAHFIPRGVGWSDAHRLDGAHFAGGPRILGLRTATRRDAEGQHDED